VLVKDLIWAYLLLINAVSFLLMGFDKLSAKVDYERVPEMWFFLISLAGGFAGVVLGMLVFHHKTSKTSFQLKITAATTLGALILAFLILRG
jgi:uncharacterized membrane protein YsdA (DUF1294 family)